MGTSRALVVSSFTIIKGSLIDETYSIFQKWDLDCSTAENLQRVRDGQLVSGATRNWLRDVAFVVSRRFDPNDRDRALVELAQAGIGRDAWKPLLLWHMTRDEFLLRDFLARWLYARYRDGTYRIRTEDVVPYLEGLRKRRGVKMADTWSEATTSRVASGLLRIATDFDLLRGSQVREFASYHLPDEGLLYVLHALAETKANADKIINAADWHMYMMGSEDVERELLRLHQYKVLRYEVAGSLSRIDLPFPSSAAYARELAA